MIEILSRHPEEGLESESGQPPLLFVHGAFAGAWVWDEFFLPWFAKRGFPAHALSLRGHGKSRGREHLDWHSISDYVEDLRWAISQLPASPILIGHSMGGFVVQKYLENNTAPRAALVCSVPPSGLFSASLSLAFSKPHLLGDLNHLMNGGETVPEVAHEALFAQPVNPERLAAWYRRMQPESHRAIWDMTLFNLVSRPTTKTPVFVMGAEHDALVPANLVEETAKAYGVQAHILPAFGHGVMLERDWELAAQSLLSGLGLDA